jgi:hypothetical protein
MSRRMWSGPGVGGTLLTAGALEGAGLGDHEDTQSSFSSRWAEAASLKAFANL